MRKIIGGDATFSGWGILTVLSAHCANLREWKTDFDHKERKERREGLNMIKAFHEPRLVVWAARETERLFRQRVGADSSPLPRECAPNIVKSEEVEN